MHLNTFGSPRDTRDFRHLLIQFFKLFYAELSPFFTFFTCLEALGTQGSTGEWNMTAITPKWYVL